MDGNFSHCGLCGGRHDVDGCEDAVRALADVPRLQAALEELRADVRELLDGVAVNGIPATDRVCEKFLRKYPELG